MTYEEQKARVKYQRDCYEHGAPVLVGNTEKNKASNDKCEDAKDYMPWWYILVAWPDGIVVWAIIATGVVIGWQGYETRRSVDVATRTLISTFRPTIIVRDIALYPKSTEGHVKGKIEDIPPWKITLGLKNSGGTVAHIQESEIEISGNNILDKSLPAG